MAPIAGSALAAEAYEINLGIPLAPAFAEWAQCIQAPLTGLDRNDVKGVGAVWTVAIDDVAGVGHAPQSRNSRLNARRPWCAQRPFVGRLSRLALPDLTRHPISSTARFPCARNGSVVLRHPVDAVLPMTPRTPSATIIRSCDKHDLPRSTEYGMRRRLQHWAPREALILLIYRQSQPLGDEMVTPTGIEPVLQP